jgi:hypothetical protein
MAAVQYSYNIAAVNEQKQAGKSASILNKERKKERHKQTETPLPMKENTIPTCDGGCEINLETISLTFS